MSRALARWSGSALLILVGCAESPVELSTGGLTVRVESEPPRVVVRSGERTLLDASSFAFRTADATWEMLYGSFRITETEAPWKRVKKFYDLGRELDEKGLAFRFDGGFGFVRVTQDGVARLNLVGESENRARLSAKCEAGEHFLGFGAQTDAVDHRGHTIAMWTSEQGVGKTDSDEAGGDWFFRGTKHQTYFPTPFFLDSRGFGVELESYRRGVFDLCNEDPNAWRVEAGEGTLSLVVLDGPGPLDVIARRATRTGTIVTVPPPFVFSPWNDAIFGSAEVRRVAGVLRSNNIPSSAIWTEDWAGGEGDANAYRLTYDWSVDRTLYPDAEALAAELHAAGFKWLGYFNTFVEADAAHYQEGEEKGYLIKKNNAVYKFDGVRFLPASLVDLTNPAAADWMAGYMDRAISVGFDGWMADFGEWLPADAELHAGNAEAVHNEYPVLFQKLNERVFQARALETDRIFFVRAGSRGSEPIRHQVVWGGDQTTDWKSDDGMPTVIPIGVGLGVSGMPFYGHDVGGYFTRPGCCNTSKELFFRWTTLGALSPIMRTHHGTEPARQWSFEKDAETLAHWKRWATLHQQLYPYLRQAAEEGASRATPMMRALALEFPNDDRAWSIADQFMLGRQLLVAPILVEGASERSVYLPGRKWIPLLGGAPLDGQREVTVSAAMTEIPAFARPGSVLILLPSSVQSLATTIATDEREVWIYLGQDGGANDPTSALKLTLTDGAPGTQLSWNGAPIGIVDETKRTATATADGPGTLQFGAATVTVEGTGRHTLVLRW